MSFGGGFGGFGQNNNTSGGLFGAGNNNNNTTTGGFGSTSGTQILLHRIAVIYH
jgi:nuclear pore complex protein Nup98-Nup96